MKIFKSTKLFILSIVFITFYSCNNSDSEKLNAESPTISIRLADKPGDFDEVNIEIVDVMIKMNNDNTDDSGWQTLNPINTGVYNLLDLTGGINVLLVDKFQIPAGTLSQIRLILGENNTVVMDGETFPLKTPSAQQSGLKLKVNTTLEEGFTYNFLLDFDVDKSIVIAGNSGNINLKPVIRVATEVSSGIIEGTVSPGDVSTMASVLVDDKGNLDPLDDEIISAYTDATGHFTLWGVPAGTYNLVLTPDEASIYAETVVTDVEVVNGQITVINPVIELNLKAGSITGKVLNENLEVSATVMVNGNPITVSTNVAGVFLLSNIPIGTYTLTLTADGYTTVVIPNVVVQTNSETIITDTTLVAVP